MWKVKVENIDSRHSITPDYKVSMTIKDYIDKKDVIVDYAIDLIKDKCITLRFLSCIKKQILSN